MNECMNAARADITTSLSRDFDIQVKWMCCNK